MKLLGLLVWGSILIGDVIAQWSGDDLAMYDLVEDLGANFYDFFGITKEASIGEIKKAYRKLSLEWHPDRNSAEGATDMFRRVVGIYEILKSTEMREKYNNVLEFGLPDWRQPIYYYRKMRKFAWYEALAVLLVISTFTHYLMMWAAYYEKKLVLTQNVKTSLKKTKKNSESEAETARALESALFEYKPQPLRLLPFLLVEGLWSLIKMISQLALDSMKKEEIVEEEVIPEKRRIVPSVPRVEYKFEMASDMKAVSSHAEQPIEQEQEETVIKQSTTAWTMDELSMLIRLSTEKYPPGSPNRWEQMARVLNRTADDVTAMAGKLKNMKQEEYAKLLRGQQSAAVNESSSMKKEKSEAPVVEWSQDEQRHFESALQRFPKGTEDRWDRVAESVPGKSKEDCLGRFKQLAELVRRRKAAA